jgi:hypothetical protein
MSEEHEKATSVESDDRAKELTPSGRTRAHRSLARSELRETKYDGIRITP